MGTQPGRILYLQPFIGSALMNLPSEVLGVSAGLDIEKRRHILWKISSAGCVFCHLIQGL